MDSASHDMQRCLGMQVYVERSAKAVQRMRGDKERAAAAAEASGSASGDAADAQSSLPCLFMHHHDAKP